LNIVELVNSLDTGGAERMAASLALHLQSRGASVRIVCLRDLGNMPIPLETFQKAGVELVALLKADGFSATTLRTLAGHIREWKTDVVHTHNPLVNHYGAMAARLGGARVAVSTIHGISTLDMPGWAKGLFWASCLITDRLVGVCPVVRETLRSRYVLPTKKTIVINNGIELARFLSVKPRLADGRFVFGTVGRLVPVKDHRRLLEAFAIVLSTHPHCRLEILGEGELKEELEEHARALGVSESVCFRGFSREIPEFLSQLDVFVMSSLSEGLPLAVLEAMAAGLPIVATGVGGVVHLVEDAGCGWLSPPAHAAALARAMRQAIETESRAALGEQGRAAVLRDYSVAKMTADYENLFRQLLNGREARS
jgi:glycosyltransferase involved in cell wall biosynthesis